MTTFASFAASIFRGSDSNTSSPAYPAHQTSFKASKKQISKFPQSHHQMTSVVGLLFLGGHKEQDEKREERQERKRERKRKKKENRAKKAKTKRGSSSRSSHSSQLSHMSHSSQASRTSHSSQPSYTSRSSQTSQATSNVSASELGPTLLTTKSLRRLDEANGSNPASDLDSRASSNSYANSNVTVSRGGDQVIFRPVPSQIQQSHLNRSSSAATCTDLERMGRLEIDMADLASNVNRLAIRSETSNSLRNHLATLRGIQGSQVSSGDDIIRNDSREPCIHLVSSNITIQMPTPAAAVVFPRPLWYPAAPPHRYLYSKMRQRYHFEGLYGLGEALSRIASA
jgi:hypothetical protein